MLLPPPSLTATVIGYFPQIAPWRAPKQMTEQELSLAEARLAMTHLRNKMTARPKRARKASK